MPKNTDNILIKDLPENVNNKYVYQKRWQDKNGYVTKTYRMEKYTSDILREFCEKNELSNRKAVQIFVENGNKYEGKEDFEDLIKKYTKKSLDESVLKSFKITKDIVDEIEKQGKSRGMKTGIYLNALIKTNIKHLYIKKKKEIE